jgi:hypothetical protein
MKIAAKTIKALEGEGFIVAFTDGKGNDVSKQKATELSLTNIEQGLIGHTIKTPKKKEVTVDWVMSNLFSTSEFKNIAKQVSKISDSVYAYPASYGIGVIVNFGFNQELVNKVEQSLKSFGIEYYNEHSSAQHVYRFVISKKKENLNKLATV